jgi:hypothetical protein
MAEPEPIDWRAALALLANADTRAVFAEVAAAPVPSGAAHHRALERLLAAGLLEPAPDGRPVVAEDRFRATLRWAATPTLTGVERFLTSAGRIVDYPSRQRDRLELLQLVARRCLREDEDLSERELGERLERFSADVATLRRYLVDAGFLDRSPDGRSYRLAAATPAIPDGPDPA